MSEIDIYEKLRKNLLNSKLITDEEWEEYQQLKKLKNILNINTTIEEKKIPEKLNKNYNIRILDLEKPYTIKDYDMEQLIEMVQDIYEKQDDIIDYLKSKGE